MLIKILCFVSLCLGAEPVKSVLKAPSEKFIIHEDKDLSPQLDFEELDIGEVYLIGLYLDDLKHHDHYQAFIDLCRPFEEISKEQSWELRYYILTSWAAEKKLKCTDHQGFFPILSTESIENVYIPLAQLLIQGFRKGTSSYPYLQDICLDSLQIYLNAMVVNGNLFTPKRQNKQSDKDRYPYKKEVLVTVAELEEGLSVIERDKSNTTIKYQDPNLCDGVSVSKRFKQNCRNVELRLLVSRNQTIRTFCYEIIYADPNLFEQYKVSKEILYTLYAKYKIMYDFIYASNYSNQIQMIGTFRFDIKTAMKEMRPVFDDVWKHYESEIEEWKDQQIADDFFPPLFAAFQQSLHSQDSALAGNLAGHALRRTTSVMNDLSGFTDWEAEFLQLHAASSQRRSLAIPLLSVNGRLIGLDRKEADH